MTVRIIQGDCRVVLRTLADASVHAVVTDPPYELGFMGKSWDSTGVAYDVDMWHECLRVLKPGGHLLAFGGTRTYHRLTCAIEDGGFEVRDTIARFYTGDEDRDAFLSSLTPEQVDAFMRAYGRPLTLEWVYGSGFPKSKNLALKPAHEPIVVARKPLIGTVATNVQEHGCGALNIDGCRVDGPKGECARGAGGQHGRYGQLGAQGFIADDGRGRWPANVIHDGSDEVLAAFPDAPGQIADASSNSSSRKTQNVYGAMARCNGRDCEPSADAENAGAVGFKMRPGARRGDHGSAARFFYCAKADRGDRDAGCDELPDQAFGLSGGAAAAAERGDDYDNGDGGFNRVKVRKNTHPTVKPTDLMRWLIRLVTPPGGVVLDPFGGSGSTGRAADIEGFDAVLIERDPLYVQIAQRRIAGETPFFTNVTVEAAA